MGIKYPHKSSYFKLEFSYIFKLEKKCILLLTFTETSYARVENFGRTQGAKDGSLRVVQGENFPPRGAWRHCWLSGHC